MKLVKLLKEKYKDKKITYQYTTDKYYDVEYAESKDGWKIEFVLKHFDKEQAKEFTESLFKDYQEPTQGFGIEVDGKIVAWLVVGVENWNKRLRIWELLVEQGYRRQGLGKMLMEKAEEIAKRNNMRMLILETQTCNFGAIEFYKKYGFHLTGCDLNCYHDDDIQRKEVRVEMSCLLS